MRHEVIQLLPRTDYDFSGLPAGAFVLNVPLIQDVDVSEWADGTLLVRLHAGAMDNGAEFELQLISTAPTDEDPSQFFRDTTYHAKVVSNILFVATMAPITPSLFRSRFGPHAGTHVSLMLSALSAKTNGSVKFTISADLALSEGIGWTPRDLGNKLTLWLDQRDQVEVANNKCSHWTDQSNSRAQNFSQSTTGSQPLISRINAFNAPLFDGTIDSMGSDTVLSAFINLKAYHVFALFAPDSISWNFPNPQDNANVLADGPTANWGLSLKNPAAGVYEAHGFHKDGVAIQDAVAAAGTLAIGDPWLVEWSFDGATIRCQLGNNTQGSAAAGNVASLANQVFVGSGSAGKFFNGRLGIVIVCNAYLSAAEVTNVRSYLAYYGYAT